MKGLKLAMFVAILLLSATFQAGASENGSSKPGVEKKDSEKGHADSKLAEPQTAEPATPAAESGHRKKPSTSRRKGAESAHEPASADTEATVKRILESSQRSEHKRRASHKKKPTQVADKHSAEASGHDAAPVDAEEAVKRLLEGNRRYSAEKNSASHRSAKRRTEVAKAQHPFAVIIGCSDSRVPPEIIFDQGIGDLFVVRTAGGVIDDVAIGSIEYAVEHLGTQLIMVLGHERCGAVDATIKGGEVGGKLKSVVDAIAPAVEKAKAKGHMTQECDLLCSSVKSNARMVAEKLRSSSTVLGEAIENGMLRTVGAYYDLDSGMVSLTYKPNL